MLVINAICNVVYQGDLKTMADKINNELHGAKPKYDLVGEEIKLIEGLVTGICKMAR